MNLFCTGISLIEVFLPLSSAEQIVFQDAPDRPQTILPADLLALGISSPGIADSDFVYATTQSRNLGNNLRLETEAIFFDPDALNDFAPEDFVTNLHIGQIQVREHVGKLSQHPISDTVPIIQDAMG